MSNYLVHYGIQGQKWGVQNGPPYPLSYDKHSRGEKENLPKVVERNSKRIKRWASDQVENVVQSTGPKSYVHNVRKNRAERVYSRISGIEDSDRYDKMSFRQRKSLENAMEYWEKRAGGKTIPPDERRGLLKRWYDMERSYSLGERLAKDYANVVYKNVTSQGLVGIGTSAVSAVIGEATDEVIAAWLFGHF